MTSFAILAYDGVEPIDIGATCGVLSLARRLAPQLSFFVAARAAGIVTMANGVRMIADHGLDDCPDHDVVMVLGGPGWEVAAADALTLDFLRARHGHGVTLAAVCTGGMILAAAGLLDGHTATTKREIVAGEARPLDLMAERHPATRTVAARIVDQGQVLTGGGVTLGIDMTLHLIARHAGRGVADETARILEYRGWQDGRPDLPDIIGA